MPSFRIAWRIFLVAIFFLSSTGWPESTQAKTTHPVVEDAVIYIEVTSQRGDWYSPWSRQRTMRSSGSGFLIAPGRILTNAHVVSDARQILVRRNGSIKPYFAKVEQIAHDSDLALLTVTDSTFSKGVRPLKLGPLPSLRTSVRTYGYPAGGEKISRTEGVVSRIDFINYLHSGADAHLGIQTDSAINPGNSGGPVVQNDLVVGVAFQTNTRLNDVGFFIPTTVVKRFLKDIEDGIYHGHPELGLVVSNLTNPVYREYLKLSTPGGVVVDRVLPESSASGRILSGDVITSIDGVKIAQDGTINYKGYRLDFQQIVEEKQVGNKIRVSLFREGKKKNLTFKLKDYKDSQRLRTRFDELPSYLIFAGFVFVKLEQEYLNTFGDYWQNAPKKLLYEHFYAPIEQRKKPGTGAVVVSRILPHSVNSAYRFRTNLIVGSINGQKIEALSDIPQALKNAKGNYHEIEFDGGGFQIVLDRKQADNAHQEILEVYGITEDRRLP